MSLYAGSSAAAICTAICPRRLAAAAESRGEFVLRSADAAIWILGKRPRGHGFVLDPESRIDTKRWAEVSGVVRRPRPRLDRR